MSAPTQAAIDEVHAHLEEQRLSSPHIVQCPDCGANLKVSIDESGRFQVTFFRHAT